MGNAWVCEYAALPGYKWFSDQDVTAPALGLTCTKLEDKPPGSTWGNYASWYKILRLITEWPW